MDKARADLAKYRFETAWLVNPLYQHREKGGFQVLTLQEKVVQKINGLSEDNLQFLLEIRKRFTRIGVMLYAEIKGIFRYICYQPFITGGCT